MAYIGQKPFQEFSSIPTKDSFTGDGSTTTFDLANDVVRGAENSLEVFIDNVRQEPGSGKAFTLGIDASSNYRRITFSSAPASGAAIYVINDKTNLTTIAPVQTDFNGVEIVLDADSDTTLHAETDDQVDLRIAGNDVLKFLQSSGDAVLKPMVDAKDIIFQQFDGNKIFEINDGNFVGVGGNATAPGEIRIYEDTDNGSNYSGFKAAASTTSSVAYQLPAADGSSGESLTTNGSGVLSWSAGVTIANDTNNRIVTADGSSGLNGEASLTFDGTTLALTGNQTVSGTITGSSTIQGTTITATTAFVPDASDGAALGTTSLEFSDLFLADSSTIQFGADQDTTLTHTDGAGLTLNSTNKLMFNDASQFIQGASATVLDIAATDEIELTATLIDVVGNLAVSGTIVGSSTLSATTGTFSGILKTDDATEATSTTDGSLQTDGGLSVVKDIVAGDDIKLLSDSAVLSFGANSEVKIVHRHDDGLRLQTTKTSDNSPFILSLESGETDIAVDDVIGQIDFAAVDEATGTDAILVAAGIAAVSEGDFSASNNATKLSFKTAASEAASEKMSLSSAGLLTVSGRIITDDTTDATSTTDGSLQTDGGLSVAKDAVIGDDLLLLSDASVIKFGADSEITLTHVHDQGLILGGTTPSLTIGDGGAEDTKIVFDGNAQNFYIGLDDSADDLLIGLGSTVGTTPAISIDENNLVTLPDGHMVINSTAAGDNLTLKSTNAGAEAGPQLVLHRDSASPANNDVIGRMRFEGEDNEGNKTIYAQLTSQIIDKGSSGGEDSTFQIEVFNNGALRDIISVVGTTGGVAEVAINEPGQDVNFRVESSGNANQLKVDGGDDIVTIGNRLFIGAGQPAASGSGFKLLVDDNAQNCADLVGDMQDTGSAPLVFRRLSHDGQIIIFKSPNGDTGDISVSGNTVSYNAFTGSHQCEPPSKTISGITKANPAVVTANSHGFSNDDTVLIESVVGMTEVNRKLFTVKNVTTNTFELNGIDSSSYTTYDSAGKAAVAPDVGHIVSFTGTNTFKNDVYPPTDIWRQAECDKGECSQSDVDNKVVRPLSYYGGAGTGEIIYGIEKSTTANDRKVLGSYLMQRPDSPDLTAAVGNHTIWVVDKGANVVVGDWILSSDVAGYAMRDDGSTYDTAYVFAMATENVDWSTVSDVVPGTSTKRKKISVLFERFVRK